MGRRGPNPKNATLNAPAAQVFERLDVGDVASLKCVNRRARQACVEHEAGYEEAVIAGGGIGLF